MFTRNLKAQYRQTVLGYMWIVLPPIAVTGVWLFLRKQDITHFESPIPYGVYLGSGLLLWYSFLDALQAPLRMVSGNRPLLTKIRFPREALIVAGLAEVVFNLLVRFILLCLALLWNDYSPQIDLLGAVLSTIALLTLGTALGLIIAPIGLLYQDIERGVSILAQFWLYLTPIVYALPVGTSGHLQLWLNPIAAILISARDGWLVGTTTAIEPLATWSLAAVVLLGIGWFMYHLAMPILIERLSD